MRSGKIQAGLAALRAAVKNRLSHLTRPLDTDDQAAALALAEALIGGVKGGFTPEERRRVEALMEAFKEARENTP
jgi:hypothetical protein